MSIGEKATNDSANSRKICSVTPDLSRKHVLLVQTFIGMGMKLDPEENFFKSVPQKLKDWLKS